MTRPALLLIPLMLLAAAGPERALSQVQPRPVSQAQPYIAGIEDVPLMTGLASAGADNLAFDSPEGRIVIATAQGAVERRAVVDFYAASLGALGWDRLGESSFRREGEQLRLDFGRRGALLTVRFTLSPLP